MSPYRQRFLKSLLRQRLERRWRRPRSKVESVTPFKFAMPRTFVKASRRFAMFRFRCLQGDKSSWHKWLTSELVQGHR